MIPESWWPYAFIVFCGSVLLKGWQWRRRRARRARKPSLLRVTVWWPGWLVSGRAERVVAWLLAALTTAFASLAIVMTLRGDFDVQGLGLALLYVAFALNLLLLLRGPETMALRRGGITWKLRAVRWRELSDYEVATQGPAATLALKTRNERITIPLPATEMPAVIDVLETQRSRFNTARGLPLPRLDRPLIRT